MATKILVTNTIPSVLPRDTVVIAKDTGASNRVVVAVSDTTGAEIFRTVSQADISSLVTNQMQAYRLTNIVPTLTQMAELEASANGNAVFAIVSNPRSGVANLIGTDGTTVTATANATGDTTVEAGVAGYMYDPTINGWLKIFESETAAESIVLSWENISGKPASTPTAIDAAVTASHEHSNKTALDKFDESNGGPTYDGTPMVLFVNELTV